MSIIGPSPHRPGREACRAPETGTAATDAAVGARRGMRVAAVLALAAALSACTTVFPAPPRATGPQPVASRRVESRPDTGGSAGQVTIWLLSGSYHTGLVLPVDWLVGNGFEPPPSVRGARWINISWGDRVAYEQKRWLTPWEVISAFAAPSESVTEMIRVEYDPRWVFPDQRVFRADVPRDVGPSLAAFLNHCALPGPGGPRWERIHPPTWGRGGLFRCPHYYGFPRLCNAWTAGALEACGYRLDAPGRIFANALIRRCLRQGFQQVPPLTDAEREFLAAYLRKTGHAAE